MTETIKRVGILSPGDMGGGIGERLHQNGIAVYTCLAGRSPLTRLRAEEAGFKDTPSLDALVGEIDLLMSVLVPSEAVPLAESVAAAMRQTGAKPVYVDCNAIAPQTVGAIERTIRDAGASFIDAGIMGSSPRGNAPSPRFHCSGPDTAPFEELRDHGLDIRVVGPKIGQASGLKMIYAAGTKGQQALWTEIMVAARALGLQEALVDELGPNNPSLRVVNSLPAMPHRARRWVGEMEEIAATFEALGLTPKILEGAADLFRFVGETPLADQTPRDPNPTLDQLLGTLTGHLHGESELTLLIPR